MLMPTTLSYVLVLGGQLYDSAKLEQMHFQSARVLLEIYFLGWLLGLGVWVKELAESESTSLAAYVVYYRVPYGVLRKEPRYVDNYKV